MPTVSRLIFALILLVQSLSGLSAVQCAAARAAAPTQLGACPCCSGGQGGSEAACPTGGGASVCRCGEPERDESQSTPTDSKDRQLQQLLASLPEVVGRLAVEPVPAAAVRPETGPAPRRNAASVQSLLCVWVM